ncbi:WD40-repeat-containing domain protein [Gorgonomyces haynaldii]|nr:WD40-repeat-containing domain protein [Gorgonomyces haynaldii]
MRIQFKESARQILTCSWSRDKIACGGLDPTIKIYNPDGLQQKLAVEYTVYQLHYDNDTVIAAAGNKILWFDARAGKEVKRVELPDDVYNMSVGDTIAVGDMQDVLWFLDNRQDKPIGSYRSKVQINEIQWKQDMLFCCSGDGEIQVIQEFNKIYSFQAHTSTFALDFDPLGRYLATGGADSFVILWDLDSLCSLESFGRLNTTIRTLGFNHDGNWLASGSEDGVIDLARTDGLPGRQIKIDSMDAPPINCLKWHRTRNILAYCSGNPKDGLIIVDVED